MDAGWIALAFDDANGELAEGTAAFIGRTASHHMDAFGQASALRRIARFQGAIDDGRRRIEHRHTVRAARKGDHLVARAEDANRRNLSDCHPEGALVAAAWVGCDAGNRVRTQRNDRSNRRRADHGCSGRIHHGRRIVQDRSVRAGGDRLVGRALDAGRIALALDHANRKFAKHAAALIGGAAGDNVDTLREAGSNWGKAGFQGPVEHSRRRIKDRHAVRTARKRKDLIARAEDADLRGGTNGNFERAFHPAAGIRSDARDGVNSQGNDRSGRRQANEGCSRRIHHGRGIGQHGRV